MQNMDLPSTIKNRRVYARKDHIIYNYFKITQLLYSYNQTQVNGIMRRIIKRKTFLYPLL